MESKIEELKDLIQMQNTLQKEVLNIKEASELTGYKRSTLYRMCNEAAIPHYKPSGGRTFFKRTELETWLLSNKVKTITELTKEENEPPF